MVLVLCGVLTGCSSVVEFEAEASTGASDLSGTSTTGFVPTTANPSGVGVTSGTTTPATDSSTTDDTAGSNLFLIDPDYTGVTPECSLFEQNCGRGEKCNIWANDGGNTWNATRCAPVDRDPGGPHDPCTVEGSGVSGIDSCDLGSVCWEVDPRTLEGTCVSFCGGTKSAPICEEAGLGCFGSNLFFLCLPDCDPLLQACQDGEACYLFEDNAECAPPPADDSGAVFETCAFPNACAPGSSCTNADFVGLCEEQALECCTPFCDLSDPDDPPCPEGTQCISPFAEGMNSPGDEDVGLCGQEPG